MVHCGLDSAFWKNRICSTSSIGVERAGAGGGDDCGDARLADCRAVAAGGDPDDDANLHDRKMPSGRDRGGLCGIERNRDGALDELVGEGKITLAALDDPDVIQ